MLLYFAPLQGYTTRAYRTAHQKLIGGVNAYFTPFLRMEHGEVRRKDLRDIDPGETSDCWIPQILVRDAEEMARLCDAVQCMGYKHIDINMGCPFPLQVHQGRGCGLLPHPDKVAALLREAEHRKGECTFSIKMRTGLENAEECRALAQMLNNSDITFITMHPRLGKQQFKGTADLDSFERFLGETTKPVVFNGDIDSVIKANDIIRRYPQLKGIMIGRGMLANPLLAIEIRQQQSERQCGEDACIGTGEENMHAMEEGGDEYRHKQLTCGKDEQAALLALHAAIYSHCVATLQGDSQILSHLHTFWDYPKVQLEPKAYKRIRKSRTLSEYREAIATLKFVNCQ